MVKLVKILLLLVSLELVMNPQKVLRNLGSEDLVGFSNPTRISMLRIEEVPGN